jgi:hypothetical protein
MPMLSEASLNDIHKRLGKKQTFEGAIANIKSLITDTSNLGNAPDPSQGLEEQELLSLVNRSVADRPAWL